MTADINLIAISGDIREIRSVANHVIPALEEFCPSPRNCDIATAVVRGESYREVGHRFNLSADRVRQITILAVRRAIKAYSASLTPKKPDAHLKNWIGGDLSVRAGNALLNGKVTTLGELQKALSDETLREDISRLPNVGRTTMQEIHEFAGVPMPRRQPRPIGRLPKMRNVVERWNGGGLNSDDAMKEISELLSP